MSNSKVTTLHTDMTRSEFEKWKEMLMYKLHHSPKHIYFSDMNLPESLHVILLIFIYRKCSLHINGHTTLLPSFIVLDFLNYCLDTVNVVFVDDKVANAPTNITLPTLPYCQICGEPIIGGIMQHAKHLISSPLCQKEIMTRIHKDNARAYDATIAAKEMGYSVNPPTIQPTGDQDGKEG